MAILGGAKVSDKIEVIENLLREVDRLLIGGAMASRFSSPKALPVGKSLVEDDKIDAARTILERVKTKTQFALPVDHLVTDRIDGSGSDEVLRVGDAAIGDRMGVDIGPETIGQLTSGSPMRRPLSGTVQWVSSRSTPFARGTNAVARAVAALTGTTIIGGGDSISAVKKAGMADRITHISTGGGASLEFLGGRTLPGVAALTDRS